MLKFSNTCMEKKLVGIIGVQTRIRQGLDHGVHRAAEDTARQAEQTGQQPEHSDSH